MQGFQSVLPDGVEILYDQSWEWAARRGCVPGGYVIVVPYRLADGSIGIAAIATKGRVSPSGAPTIYWDWQQEAVGPRYWQEIRYFAELPGWILLSFLGLGEDGKWWLGVVHGPCHAPSLYALLPVSNPDQTFLEAEWIGENKLLYWVLDGDRLTLYGWEDNEPVVLWVLHNVRGNAVHVRRQDVTGDGQAELFLMWERAGRSNLLQIYQEAQEGFALRGELEATYHQYVDTDGDGLAEYVWPVPPDHPNMWRVYGWDGERFGWKPPLVKPLVPVPTRPITDNLPPLPVDVYLGEWLWPREGGPMRLADGLPPISDETSCPNGLPGERVISCSPDCQFALIEVPGETEGGSLGIVSADESMRWEIPDSFIYVQGYSTFAWDPDSRFLIHARADGGEGLYRIDLYSGQVETLVPLGASWDEYQGRYFGAVHPIVLPDGSILFTIQGADPAAYPSPGIYRLWPNGSLCLLADIPLVEPDDPPYGPVHYGGLVSSPRGDMFVYRYNGSHGPFVLLGLTEGNSLWDLSEYSGATIGWGQ